MQNLIHAEKFSVGTGTTATGRSLEEGGIVNKRLQGSITSVILAICVSEQINI